MPPLVSVNITTLNSEKTFKECLDSLADQTYKDFEIVVIDSHSKDRTVDIAKDYGARIFFAPTLAAARKTGVLQSRGDYIFIVCSDQILEPDVISQCVKTCEEENYDGVTIFERSLITKNSFLEKVIAYDKEIFHSLHDDDPVRGTAIPRFFKSSYFKRVDFDSKPPVTFEHTLIHQEILNMGARIKFIDCIVWHHETTTVRQLMRKFFRYGYYYLPAFGVDKRIAIHHSLPRRTYFHYRAFRNPVLFLGLFYVYFLKAVSAGFGALAYLVKKGDK